MSSTETVGKTVGETIPETVPKSISCMSTYASAHELFGLLTTIHIQYGAMNICCTVDSKTRNFIQAYYQTVFPNLHIDFLVLLDTYTNMDRKSMTSEQWNTFQSFKGHTMIHAITRYEDTLFLDADIFLLDRILIPKRLSNVTLGVSPHYIQKESRVCKSYGYYNGGLLYASDISIPKKWIEFSASSRYFDQAAIEDLVIAYPYFEFPEHTNIGLFRFTHAKNPITSLHACPRTHRIMYKDQPATCVHTHFGRSGYKTLNAFLIQHLKQLQKVPELVCIEFIKNKKWSFILPKQPRNDKFNHKDDSFREIPQLWMNAHQNDVLVQKSPDITQCWFMYPHVVLYDRPTLMWTHPEIQRASLILVGNGDHEECDTLTAQFKIPAHPWIFWPRRPIIVEQKVSLILENETKTLHDPKLRAYESCFIGGYTTSVQQKHRTLQDWKEYISYFHLQQGNNYKFTNEEYLDFLKNTRYGLCLRGFGKKCHREVECMAMGTVPIVTPDMSISYNDTLVENIHYVYVEKPEDIPIKLEQITDEQWSYMSHQCFQWYLRNVSTQSFHTLLKQVFQTPS